PSGLSPASNGHVASSAHLRPPAPRRNGRATEPSALRSRTPPLEGRRWPASPAPPAHPSVTPCLSIRQGLRSSPGQGLPVRGRSPQSTRPLHNGAPPVVAGCATIRVASRALKDSIADLIAAGKIELQCSTRPRAFAELSQNFPRAFPGLSG